ncbi:hypothetical protein AB4Y45_33965 [Paraburkholderia sp. EG287A]|uniref:hypothetical protein n=1 Tax=Paraburkholderia sp. EG287A TaxID=3237012 RepID=UPI0034D16CD9
MRQSSPVDAVASAVHHAALLALPDIHYERRDFEAFRAMDPKDAEEARRTDTLPMKPASRRPDVTECEVHAMFVQRWGSTAMGFGSIGGAAVTPAYTVVVKGPDGHFAVYWAGRLAYLVDPARQSGDERAAFEEDLANRWTASRNDAATRYGCIATEHR